MALRAVIFDYGMVLTGPPDLEAWAALLRITGLSDAELKKWYWHLRPQYDDGRLNGLGYWQELTTRAGLKLSGAQIEELNSWDTRVWTTENLPMIEWQQRLKQRGLRTAILSNMGDAIHDRMKQLYGWLDDFDVLIWSYLLGVSKPDEAIYRHALKELGLRPEETFFLDDKKPNVDAAVALGMVSHQFTTVARLREFLLAEGLDAELPLPG